MWCGIIEEDAKGKTVAEHTEILHALRQREPVIGEAAAIVQVATEESLRRMMNEPTTDPYEGMSSVVAIANPLDVLTHFFHLF